MRVGGQTLANSIAKEPCLSLKVKMFQCFCRYFKHKPRNVYALHACVSSQVQLPCYVKLISDNTSITGLINVHFQYTTNKIAQN